MKLSDFDYILPKERIAQYPFPKRDESRLLVLRRDTGEIEHSVFKGLPQFLREGDICVLNDTKVAKARLVGKREAFDGKIEILLADKLKDNLYSVLSKPSRKLKQGTRLIFGDGSLSAEVIGQDGDFRLVRFDSNGDLSQRLEEMGNVPLPPYIKRAPDKNDESRYQTVYAKNIGAIAAPTAGLHFTERLLDRLNGMGVEIAFLTLHVGYATFKPVGEEEDISMHKMHEEHLEISKGTAEKINRAKKEGGRVISVGTTSCRALESSVIKRNIPLRQGYGGHAHNAIRNTADTTNIFIYPGFEFKVTDALLTNFHLPRTTLLMLVCAFAGRDNLLKAYQEAIRMGYRFYSYGDAMLVV